MCIPWSTLALLRSSSCHIKADDVSRATNEIKRPVVSKARMESNVTVAKM
jgi:hypothetical protein